MRPVATPHSAIQHPLDDLLGAPANVRLLRLMALDVQGPISAGDAASRAGLTHAGARRALDRMVETGLVREVGGGRARLFELVGDEPVVASLAVLFDAERERFDRLVAHLREVLSAVHDIRFAWLETPPAARTEPLRIGLVGDARTLADTGREVRTRIADIEREFRVSLEIHTHSVSEAPAIEWNEVTLLAGIPPAPPKSDVRRGVRHEDRDRRALDRARAVALMIKSDPSIVIRARRHVQRLLESDHGAASHDLREWAEILDTYPPERLREFVASETPRATRLRQSSPFLAVLSPEERRAFENNSGSNA
jgi:DNA-binding transcriptional ArsR family regulator